MRFVREWLLWALWFLVMMVVGIAVAVGGVWVTMVLLYHCAWWWAAIWLVGFLSLALGGIGALMTYKK
jgi:hypothetical protein